VVVDVDEPRQDVATLRRLDDDRRVAAGRVAAGRAADRRVAASRVAESRFPSSTCRDGRELAGPSDVHDPSSRHPDEPVVDDPRGSDDAASHPCLRHVADPSDAAARRVDEKHLRDVASSTHTRDTMKN